MKIQALPIAILLLLLVFGCSASPPSEPAFTQAAATLPSKGSAILSPVVTAASQDVIATFSVENAGQAVSAGVVAVSNPAQLAWDSSSQKVAVFNSHAIFLVDRTGQQVETILQLPDSATLLSFSAKRMKAAVNPGDGTLQILDVTRSHGSQDLQPGGPYSSASFSPDGRWLAVASVEAIETDIWDLQSGQKVKTVSGFESAPPSYSVSFSTSGEQLVWLSRGTLQMMDFTTSQFGPALAHEDAVSAYDLSADGRILAAASAGTTPSGEFQPAVFLWNAVSGGLLATLPQEQPVTALAFSPDARLLAVASGNKIVLWEPASQQMLVVLPGHTDLISVLRFSPDGTLLVSASADQTVRFWQTQAQ